MQKEAIAAPKAAQSLKNEAGRGKTRDANQDGSKIIAETAASTNEWAGFSPGRWDHTIDVRDFIQRNVAPYHGDEMFLAAPTECIKAVRPK